MHQLPVASCNCDIKVPVGAIISPVGQIKTPVENKNSPVDISCQLKFKLPLDCSATSIWSGEMNRFVYFYNLPEGTMHNHLWSSQNSVLSPRHSI